VSNTQRERIKNMQ